MPPQAASSAILERDSRYLLVLRRNPPAAEMYAFPGGRAESGETPAETALREFAEETGIVAREPRLYATYDLASSSTGNHYFLSVFRVEADRDAVAVAADDAADLGWFTAEEIAGLPAPESVRDCIRRLEADRGQQQAQPFHQAGMS
ncbi:NUDIX domain-containing protein [Rhizobium sp. ARZ01]|uniref:NUDIX domain-containing protein n=1 Tax=Rhizobium sp. ARZ01 TaxID=2769313 RepID=UPI00177B0727|nr:NUDIX domain-containing protein [Rhizobium sp. ARZ01]MBD9371661.1 NUDIX domain-containing protein [Rhizobium sp. ARZ01]